MLSAADRYVDCEGPTTEGAPHFRYTIPDGNAVITGEDSSEFSLKVERIIKGQPTYAIFHATISNKARC